MLIGLTAADGPGAAGQAADLARRADLILSTCPPHAHPERRAAGPGPTSGGPVGECDCQR
jgi:hypothetical protein